MCYTLYKERKEFYVIKLHINEEKEMVKLIKNPLNEMAKIGTFGNKVGESGNYEVWV